MESLLRALSSVHLGSMSVGEMLFASHAGKPRYPNGWDTVEVLAMLAHETLPAYSTPLNLHKRRSGLKTTQGSIVMLIILPCNLHFQFNMSSA